MSNEFENSMIATGSHVNRSKVLLIGFPPGPEAEIAEALAAVNWGVLTARGSDQAAHQCAASQFDFVLIDVDRVDQFAPGLVNKLRDATSLNARATIVAFSEYFMPEFRDRLSESGVDGFCSMPLEVVTLLATLTKASVNRALSANSRVANGEFPFP